MSDVWAFWCDGFYFPFAVVAYAVVALRIWTMTFSGKEWFILFVFLGHHALQVAQLWVGDGALNDLVYRLRYFYPLAPLLWLWTAYGVWRLWQCPGRKRAVVRAAMACIGVALFVYEVPVRTAIQVQRGARSESRQAGEAFAPIIRADYKGPASFPDFRPSPTNYYVNRRPMLGPCWDNSAWPLRTQSLDLGSIPGHPLPDYYVSIAPIPAELAPHYTWLATKQLRKRTFYLYRLNPEPTP